MLGRKSAQETNPKYGQGEAILELDDDVLLDEEELTKRLLDTFSAPHYRPPTLPSVATELLSLSRKPDVAFDDIAALLEQDTLLTGQVMKLMQSPLYTSATAITSIKDAVVRIGLNVLCDVVLEASLNMRVFRADAYMDSMERLRRHCTLTAHLSRIVCRYTAIEGEYAFLCGLLHDVGIAGTLIALSDGSRRKPPPDLVAIWPAVDRVHAEAATLMAKLWGLPMEIQLVLGAHHRVMIDGFAHPLAATVCLAEDVAHELGCGLVPGDGGAAGGAAALEHACLQSHTRTDRSSPKSLEQARTALRITDEQMELIYQDSRKLQEKLD